MYTKRLNGHSKVAMYLRKSRLNDGESVDDTLQRHKARLDELIERYGFTEVTTYKDVASGGSIEARPDFVRLLEHVESGAYDAVIAVDIDRISRGSLIEQGTIQEAFARSHTLIVTPSKVYDMNDDNDILTNEFSGLIARQELSKIKQRLRQGKISATKEGKHANGKTPWPYYYDRNTRTVKVDESKRQTYDYIKRLYIKDNLSTEQLATRLNAEEVPSISGKRIYDDGLKRYRPARWTTSQIRRLLQNNFHVGYVSYNKNYRDHDGKLRKSKPEDVITVKGTHEALLTEDEHAYVKERLDATRLMPKNARKGNWILGGMIKCYKCGRTMTFRRKAGSDNAYLSKCNRRIGNGVERCDGNRGCPETLLVDIVKNELIRKQQHLLNYDKKNDKTSEDTSQSEIEYHKANIEKYQQRIDRLTELYLDADIDKDNYRQRKEAEEVRINQSIEALQQLQADTGDDVGRSLAERMEGLTFEAVFNDWDTQEAHKALMLLIDKVMYRRDGDNISVEISYK